MDKGKEIITSTSRTIGTPLIKKKNPLARLLGKKIDSETMLEMLINEEEQIKSFKTA